MEIDSFDFMVVKKAILTGGGHATRLRPITTTINKHLIPLANKPMIFYAIEKVVEVGVREIAINVNPGETELQKYVGDGGHWGVNIRYFEQTGGPQGIAHVVSCARDFLGDDPFIFFLSDNIILGSLKEMADKFTRGGYSACLAFAEVPDPERFGVPEFDESGNLKRVVEKPTHPACNMAQTGIYFYDKHFFDAFSNIKKSDRGEYEISDINTWLLENGFKVGWEKVKSWWKDTGKPIDLITANQLLLDQLNDADFQNNAVIEQGARIEGKVSMGHGTRVGPKVVIRGPVIIGENCVLEDCIIGPYATIGAGTEVYSAEIEHSIIFDNVDINCPLRILDSIIGKNATIISGHQIPQGGHKMLLGDNTSIEM
ncbi:MAG TPA: glucose-1-phosphate thymidylyltransferase [Candidatus Magasanikbacteria bacterium]|nr:glucose-1-phosphate thymidylyltransferase [Candidatus Magasanikbacteria bacterium]